MCFVVVYTEFGKTKIGKTKIGKTKIGKTKIVKQKTKMCFKMKHIIFFIICFL